MFLKKIRLWNLTIGLAGFISLVFFSNVQANPWNGKVVFQGFWWDSWHQEYPNDWYTYLAKLAPRLRNLGIDGIWIPAPTKGNAGENSMGYDVYDHYDLGDKYQKGRVETRFGTKDSLLRMIAVAHANGLDVYPDIVLNHTMGGQEDLDAPGDKYKRFRYSGFGGPERGRWAKDHWNFHPNPDHYCSLGEWCEQKFGPDNCFLDQEHGGGGNGRYMRDMAREWFVWLARQTDADGFRFDAVKHFPSYVVEDLLYHAMGDRLDYFAVGEFVGGRQLLDAWAAETQNRAGTFDFSLRDSLSGIVEAGGYFNMGKIPNFQQENRLKTVPFINNHDTWRGVYWDSEPGSSEHDDRSGDWRQNGDELAPTIDPDNPRADVAYAVAFSVDGSPSVYYEDLFVNYGPDRFKADPKTFPFRPYLVNLIWAHQKLNFKDGAYKVRYQDSPDLLVIERSGKALIGVNDHGNEWKSAWVKTDFGPNMKLHDYSGALSNSPETDGNGWVNVSVPPMGYVILGPVGIQGGFSPRSRPTIQEFQLADDLGDRHPQSLGYGGDIRSEELRTAGSIWTAPETPVRISVFTEGEREVEVQVHQPDEQGKKSWSDGVQRQSGSTSNDSPLVLEFVAEREGYHQISAKLRHRTLAPTRAYLKVEYQAPAESEKF